MTERMYYWKRKNIELNNWYKNEKFKELLEKDNILTDIDTSFSLRFFGNINYEYNKQTSSYYKVYFKVKDLNYIKEQFLIALEETKQDYLNKFKKIYEEIENFH